MARLRLRYRRRRPVAGHRRERGHQDTTEAVEIASQVHAGQPERGVAGRRRLSQIGGEDEADEMVL